MFMGPHGAFIPIVLLEFNYLVTIFTGEIETKVLPGVFLMLASQISFFWIGRKKEIQLIDRIIIGVSPAFFNLGLFLLIDDIPDGQKIFTYITTIPNVVASIFLIRRVILMDGKH